MIIDAISDLHGFLPKTQGGDLLIVAGDLTANDSAEGYLKFFIWIAKQQYRKKIVIAGNHDMQIHKKKIPMASNADFQYLQDSGTEFEGLKMWGSPWTKTFWGINPHCTAFTVDSETKLERKWNKIPDGIDILITHSPPFGVLDQVKRGNLEDRIERTGSECLYGAVHRIKPKLHFFGHIHEGRGQDVLNETKCFNCSHVDREYNPIYKPFRVIL